MTRLRALGRRLRALGRRLPAIGRRLRPTSRAGALASALVIAVLVGGAAVVAVAFPWVYGEYGFHPEQNARSWAALTPRYADPASCAQCHETEHFPWSVAQHRAVTCDSCHGPLAEHAATAPTEPSGRIAIEAPPEGLCALCHEMAPGRPAEFAQVDLTRHYAGAPCLGCHDSHSASAVRPHDITHALERLPACVTCHAPAGLKPVPVGHEEAPDSVCLTCHIRPATGSRSVP